MLSHPIPLPSHLIGPDGARWSLAALAKAADRALWSLPYRATAVPMLEEVWPLGAVAVSLVVIAWLVRRGPRRSHFEDDAWASVRLTYTEQADGIFPVAVVRVQNPALVPVVVSASVRRARARFMRRRHRRWGRTTLSVRSPKVSRRPRVPEGDLLGIVSGGAVGVWQLPVGSSGRLPAVEVRLDQAGPRTKVFVWGLSGSPAPRATTVENPHPALSE